MEIGKIRAFLPRSLVDTKMLKPLEGQELEFKVVKMDKARNNIVLSRKPVGTEEDNTNRQNLFDNLQEGQEVTGTIKNLTDYGAFVDLGGIDGLLHY